MAPNNYCISCGIALNSRKQIKCDVCLGLQNIDKDMKDLIGVIVQKADELTGKAQYKLGRLEAFKEIAEIIVTSKPEEVFTNILTLFKKEDEA